MGKPSTLRGDLKFVSQANEEATWAVRDPLTAAAGPGIRAVYPVCWDKELLQEKFGLVLG